MWLSLTFVNTFSRVLQRGGRFLVGMGRGGGEGGDNLYYNYPGFSFSVIFYYTCVVYQLVCKFHMLLKSMRRSGTEAIRTQIQLSKPKLETTNHYK